MFSGALTLLTLFGLATRGHGQQCADDCFSAVRAYDHDPDFSRPWGCSYLMTTKVTPPVVTATVAHTKTDVYKTEYTMMTQFWALRTKDAWRNKRDGARAAPSKRVTVAEQDASLVPRTDSGVVTPLVWPTTSDQVARPSVTTSLSKPDGPCPAPRRVTSMVVPQYAAKCGSNAAFSSACSCLGFNATTTTVEPCTSLVHAWDVIRSRTTRTLTRTVDVSPGPCQTPYFFHIGVLVEDLPVGVLTVNGEGEAQVLENDGPGRQQPAIFYNHFNGHLEHGHSYAVVDSFDRTEKIRFKFQDPLLKSSSIFALTCHLGPDCDGSFRCVAGRDSRNITSVCLGPQQGLYIGEGISDPENCVPVTLEIFNVPNSKLRHEIPLPVARA